MGGNAEGTEHQLYESLTHAGRTSGQLRKDSSCGPPVTAKGKRRQTPGKAPEGRAPGTMAEQEPGMQSAPAGGQGWGGGRVASVHGRRAPRQTDSGAKLRGPRQRRDNPRKTEKSNWKGVKK